MLRVWLIVTILSAWACAAAPTLPPDLVEAQNILRTCTDSLYAHKTAVNEKTGFYHFDCSGLLDYVLKRTDPAAYNLIPFGRHKRPLAVDFYTTFATASAAPSMKPGWQQIRSLAHARPGDIIAWRRVKLIQHEDTGHVMLIASAPLPDGDHRFRVTVIDSVGSPHANDSRVIGHTGIGRGTMWFNVDDDGRPTAFHWRRSESPARAVPIAIGRPTE